MNKCIFILFFTAFVQNGTMQASGAPAPDNTRATNIIECLYPDKDNSSPDLPLGIIRRPNGFNDSNRPLAFLVLSNQNNDSTNFDEWFSIYQSSCDKNTSCFTLEKTKLQHSSIFKLCINGNTITHFAMNSLFSKVQLPPECCLSYLLTAQQTIAYKKWYCSQKWNENDEDDQRFIATEMKEINGKRILLLFGKLYETYTSDLTRISITSLHKPCRKNKKIFSFDEQTLEKDIANMQMIHVDFAEEQKKDQETQQKKETKEEGLRRALRVLANSDTSGQSKASQQNQPTSTAKPQDDKSQTNETQLTPPSWSWRTTIIPISLCTLIMVFLAHKYGYFDRLF